MLLVMSKFLIIIVSLQLTFAIHQYENNNGLRNTRPRNGHKRPGLGDQYIIKPSSVYSIENNGAVNQWKPILDLPSNHPLPARKHRKPKPHRTPLKHLPNVIFTTEYYPKQIHQSASTNFIANQSLVVSDFVPQQQVKPHSSKTKLLKPQTYTPKHTGSHYEVHEQVNEDDDATQNRFRYQEVATNNPVNAPVTEQHIHQVHYQKVFNDGRHLGRPGVRKIWLGATSRRPY